MAPPLSLFGQKPDESRVDGFWVRRTTEEQRKAELMNDVKFSDSELASVDAWGTVLTDTIHPYEERYKNIGRERDENLKRVRHEAEDKKKALKEEEQALYRQLLGSKKTAAALSGNENSINRRRIGRNRSQLKQYFAEQGVSGEKWDGLYRLLRTYPPAAQDVTPPREKTDPAKEAVKVIEDIE